MKTNYTGLSTTTCETPDGNFVSGNCRGRETEMGFTNRNKAIAVARDKADWRRLVNSSILPEERQDNW